MSGESAGPAESPMPLRSLIEFAYEACEFFGQRTLKDLGIIFAKLLPHSSQEIIPPLGSSRRPPARRYAVQTPFH